MTGSVVLPQLEFVLMPWPLLLMEGIRELALSSMALTLDGPGKIAPTPLLADATGQLAPDITVCMGELSRIKRGGRACSDPSLRDSFPGQTGRDKLSYHPGPHPGI